MRYPKAPWLLCMLVTGLLTVSPAWHRAPTEVDLALVLAVDVSSSMDSDKQDLQRQGYVESFHSPLVHQAIRTGILGRIAVTYVE
jgi:nitric oxide reductase activation protein